MPTYEEKLIEEQKKIQARMNSIEVALKHIQERKKVQNDFIKKYNLIKDDDMQIFCYDKAIAHNEEAEKAGFHVITINGVYYVATWY